ncbi:hypothetical protein [Halobaculum rarum]|uniref:hypothetical protein n=1 Tax=Halobaculum rarum TaxID=3075122 RepID=UPI0032AEC751
MTDSPSTEELRRIRHTLIWLVLVVAAAGLHDPETFGGLSDGAYLILVVSLFASAIYFVVQLFDIDARTDAGDS